MPLTICQIPHRLASVTIPRSQYEALRTKVDAQARELMLMQRVVDDLATDARRYKLVRTLNVREFSEVYVANLDGEGMFDGLIDKLCAKRGGRG